jgi:putative transposase
MIEEDDEGLSISRQCELLGVSRSSYYYNPILESEYNLLLMKEIDQLYLDYPFYGSRQMTNALILNGFEVNRKRVSRLMRLMCIEALYPKPKVKTTYPGNIKFPYLLTDFKISAQNQVWRTDITYVPVEGGYLYLVAFLDLYSRFVVSWQLSNTLEAEPCIEALEMALKNAVPEIINSDQGVQYTSHAYIDLVQSKGIRISMSGKGRCWDNIFTERFWRTLKCEEVFLKQYMNYRDAYENIANYIDFYNNKRPHSALGNRPPKTVCSPILANVFAHYALDLWIQEEIKPSCKGRVEIFRYADDAVICCQYKEDALRLREILPKHLEQFKLELNEEKTKLAGPFNQKDLIKKFFTNCVKYSSSHAAFLRLSSKPFPDPNSFRANLLNIAKFSAA